MEVRYHLIDEEERKPCLLATASIPSARILSLHFTLPFTLINTLLTLTSLPSTNSMASIAFPKVFLLLLAIASGIHFIPLSHHHLCFLLASL